MSLQVTIDLKKEWKELILEGMQNGIDVYYNESRHISRALTHNGRSQTIWDLMNTEIDRALPKDRFKIIVNKRGIWELVLIYDYNTKTVYSLMKTKRLREIKKRILKTPKIHYLEALCDINITYGEDRYIQLDLLETSEKEQEKIDDILFKILLDIKDEAQSYVLLTFDIQDKGIKNPVANILSVNLNTLGKEEWQQYIRPSYVQILQDTASIFADTETDEIKLELKVGIKNTFKDHEVEVPLKREDQKDTK